MNNKISIGLSVLAIVASSYAIFQPPQVVGTAKYQPDNLTIAENVQIIDSIVLDLTNAVEELRVEIAHVHELNIELGDNLDQRIDDLGATVGTLSNTVSDNAAAAKAYADEKVKGIYDWIASVLPKLPSFSDLNPFS